MTITRVFDSLASSSVGILAYGSLIDEPGAEIEAVTVKILKDDIETPFNVEYARVSRTRKGAPTLVPVEGEGQPVKAVIILVDATVHDATSMLWRRETGRVGRRDQLYTRPMAPSLNDVLVDTLKDFHGVGAVLYTRIGANLSDRTPAKLAEHAVASARALRDGRDGISYLIAAKRNGIKTALSDRYEEEINTLVGVRSLTEALDKLGVTSAGADEKLELGPGHDIASRARSAPPRWERGRTSSNRVWWTYKKYRPQS